MSSTLGLTRSKLKAEVGFFLGWGRGTDFGDEAWSTDEDNAIESCVSSGLRRFYFPPQPSGFFDWSFLKPVVTLTLPANSSSLILPEDFNGIQGPITITTSGTSTGCTWWPVITCNEGQVRQMYAAFPTQTGRPTHAAVRPQRTLTGTEVQRFELAIFPTADLAYVLKFAYAILPDALTQSLPLPYGGAAHAETILESCLAVAEERLDNEQTVHRAAFQMMLQASMAQDRRMKPQYLGQNADYSDDQFRWRSDRPFSPVSVYGNTY